MDERPDITVLLRQAHDGDAAALDAVARAFHADLLRHARRLLAGRRGPRARPITLEPAELVNETFIKLLQQRQEFKNRQHFFAIATRVMLRALMDYHKARARQKRFGGQLRVSLSALGRDDAAPPRVEVPELALLLDRLERLDARVAQVVKLRALWGLTSGETAEVLAVSRATADRDWRFGRAWLATELGRKGGGSA